MSDPIKLSMLINGDSDSHKYLSMSTTVVPTPTPTSTPTPTQTPGSSSTTTSSTPASATAATPTLNSATNDNINKSKTRTRKKTQTGPPFACQFPGCDKSFQRSEHLSRHKLNHNPKKIFNCSYPSCDKTFVRHDLLVRHEKRHEKKIEKKRSQTNQEEFLNAVVSNNLKKSCDDINSKSSMIGNGDNNKNTNLDNNNNNNNNMISNDKVSVKDIVNQHPQFNNISTFMMDKYNKLNRPMNIDKDINDVPINTPNILNSFGNVTNNQTTSNLFNWLFTDGGLFPGSDLTHQTPDNYFDEPNIPSSSSNKLINNSNANNENNENNSNFFLDLNEFQVNNNANNFFIVQDVFSPTSSSTGYFSSTEKHGINEKILTDNENENLDGDNLSHFQGGNDNLQSFQQSQGHQLSNSAVYQLDENLLYTLTNEQMHEFENLVPALKGHIDFTKLKLEKALKTYWNFFHPRFPMLHRPTFNSMDAPLLLLLSMIVLGSKLFMCVDNITCPDEKKIIQPKSLSDIISEPLRWLLFASPFFQPPAEVWIIQSLLMLEFYEKHCSNRRLHERAHLHHGTTIQLLRRSPTLGGSSTKLNNDTSNEDSDNWCKWIEIESMKRATFMCFYMDAIDAISLGHQMFIYSHQIQMTMPVADCVWESNFNQFNKNFKNSERPKPFLIALRNVMNGKTEKTNSFGKKILLAGLNAILFQIQQRDLQLFFGLDKFGNTVSMNWRDLLTAAFAIWRNDVGGSCCSSKTAIDNLNSLGNSSQFSTSDTRCKCIAYHIAHIYMSISHYDIFIVCGAPWRMNVKPSSNLERNSIKNRVIEWSKTRHCEVSIVQCYLSLFEMFLSPQDSPYEYQYDYLPDADLFFRSYSIGYMLLVIWSYLYAKDKFKNININHEDNNNGYTYLKNIRSQFTTKSKGILLHTWFTNPSGAKFYGHLMSWVNVLNEIENIGNMLGLLKLVGEKFSKADYVVIKEIGKLLLFCRDRSIGVTYDEILEDMYLPR